MRRNILVLIGLLGVSLGMAAPSLGRSEEVTVSKRACRELVAHQPAPDVAYRPGVDARGRSVASADLEDGSRIVLPSDITVPMTVDLFARTGRKALRGAELRSTVGEVRYSDGHVTFNDRPLGEACRAAGY